jgi:hypothetical protein
MRKRSEFVETHLLGRIEQDNMRHIKIRRMLLGGKPVIDMRSFVVDGKGRHVPTPKGTWIPEDQVGKLQRIVERAIEACGHKGHKVE